MTTRLLISILFIALFVATAVNTVQACGHEHKTLGTKQETSSKSCCQKPVKNATATSGHSHSGKGCPCDHAHGDCHCPGCGLICHSSGAYAMEIPLAIIVHAFHPLPQKGAFYFADRLPEDVYLTIWQPPKLGA